LDGVFTKQQLRRGLDRIYIDAKSLRKDSPDFYANITKLVLKLVKEEVLTNQVLLKVPVEIREEMVLDKKFYQYFQEDLRVFDNEVEIKEIFAEIVISYLENYDSTDIIKNLKNLGHSDIVRPWFIRKAILVSCGMGNKEREKVSQLLKELSTELNLNYAMYSYCFDHLIQNCQDYMLDIPHFPEYLSMFMARAIYDGCFNAMYILYAETFDSSDDYQLQVLKSCSFYAQDHIGESLVHIWGSAFSNQELCSNFDEIIESYNDACEDTEICQKLKDLDCKYYYHEFVTRLVLFYSNLKVGKDVDYGRLRRFINNLFNYDVLGKEQFEMGVKKAKHTVTVVSKDDIGVNENFKNLHEGCLSQIRFKFE
jgi:hypothetical protein